MCLNTREHVPKFDKVYDVILIVVQSVDLNNSPVGSTRSRAWLACCDVLGVKKGMDAFELSSLEAEARGAVNPIDYRLSTAPRISDDDMTYALRHSSLDDIIQANESATQNEENVGGVNCIRVRFGCLNISDHSCKV